MKVTNSYIFLKKEAKQKEQNVIYLNFDVLMPRLFEKIFNIPENDALLGDLEENPKKFEKEIDKYFYNVDKGNFKYKYKEENILVEYKFIKVNDTYYLDIITNDVKKSEVVYLFDEINKKIISNKDILRYYIPIQSYDVVSEIYCNKIYPKLNNFERKIRKLLFLTYTSLFKEEYFEVTTSQELQNNVKERIRKPKNNNTPKEEYRIQNFFYSLDYGNMIELLFNKNWTVVEENKIKNFLEDNDKINELEDKDIRDFIKDIQPHSDWERFFYKKGFCENFEQIIQDINFLRNCVAHNKIFNKELYDELNLLLKCANKEIDKAIKYTEKEDFRKINEEHFNETMKNIGKSIRKFTQTMVENLNNVLKSSFFEKLQEITNNIYNIK